MQYYLNPRDLKQHLILYMPFISMSIDDPGGFKHWLDPRDVQEMLTSTEFEEAARQAWYDAEIFPNASNARIMLEQVIRAVRNVYS